MLNSASRPAASRPAQAPLQVVFATTEVAPWSKVGGLGDVMGALPAALAARGHRVMTVAPRYAAYKDAVDTAFRAALGAALRDAHSAFCIHNLAYQGGLPLTAFGRLCLPRSARAALEWPQPTGSSSDRGDMAGGAADSAGVGPATEGLGVERPRPECAPSRVDMANGQHNEAALSLNWMHAALAESDAVLTVSPTYAREICEDTDMACGMQRILRARGVRGIMNGLDVCEWDPATDAMLPARARFAAAEDAARGKAAAKRAAQRRFGLTADPSAPLMVYIGRLTGQKGVDVILSAAPALLGPAPGVPPLPPCAGPPSPDAAAAAAEVDTDSAEASSARSAGIATFREEAAHLLVAAADFVLVPSRFEPCGLVAQAAVRYGAVPIVAPVGGLADLVVPGVGYQMGCDPDAVAAGGAQAHRAAVRALTAAAAVALRDFATPRHAALRARCLALDVSWDRPAAEWEAALYAVAASQ
ncbi:hypothetical protein WJX81_001768 [Elliptochloris bilobata]|uniref:Starch synthase catalytic domain-containing protein n=1 Tax=Elliptochloris bilobata TaxID=381761 RepID=A0AAW1QID6_9CHLO